MRMLMMVFGRLLRSMFLMKWYSYNAVLNFRFFNTWTMFPSFYIKDSLQIRFRIFLSRCLLRSYFFCRLVLIRLLRMLLGIWSIHICSCWFLLRNFFLFRFRLLRRLFILCLFYLFLVFLWDSNFKVILLWLFDFFWLRTRFFIRRNEFSFWIS